MNSGYFKARVSAGYRLQSPGGSRLARGGVRRGAASRLVRRGRAVDGSSVVRRADGLRPTPTPYALRAHFSFYSAFLY